MVNNAGCLRDRMIFSMSEEEFDVVISVHLKGHFNYMRMVTAYWREQSKASGAPIYGRIINTASEAFLFGSVGQPNYAAAKGGILTLTLNQAAELGRYGITANAVAPQGRTGMTEKVFAEMMKPPEDGSFDVFDPANVAPLVGYLSSPQAGKISGEVFVVWGNQVQILQRPTLTEAFANPAGEPKWDVDALHESLASHYDDNYVPVWGGYSVPPM